MGSLIFIIILGVIAIVAIILAIRANKLSKEDEEYRIGRNILGAVAGVFTIGTLLVLFLSTFYTNGVGEAKVKVSYTGTVSGQVDEAGAGFKSPLDSFEDFDLFSQNISYVGNGDTNYSGGDVNGPQITSAVQGGTQANFDLSVVYSIDPADVTNLYTQFKSQENFTKQIIEPAIRSTTRDIPGNYSAVEFRTTKHAEAQQAIQDVLSKQLSPYGVKVEQVNLQEVRYNDQVEASLSAVTAAEQSQAAAEANLEAAKVTAQQNKVLSDSLTPVLIQQQYIQALQAIGEKGNMVVVPEGSSPLINVPTPTQAPQQ